MKAWLLIFGAAIRWIPLLMFSGLLLGISPAKAADDGITDYVVISPGAYIIDTGSLTPTVANSLKPYGLVFDLVRNQKVPVLWAINPSKAKDGPDFTDVGSGKAYRAGPFIVRAEFATSTVLAVINSWRAQGVVVDGPTTQPTPSVPIYDAISGIANIVLDSQNGSIAAAYYTAAGVPNTAYRIGTPASLNSCDDMYVMPHADPTWATHSNLLPFVQSRGYIWAACHAVSVLENIDNPATVSTNPDLNFLSISGLVPFGSHAGGSPPYTTASPGDPVMQFIGVTDAAQQNGSEQIYLPRLLTVGGLPTGGWRPGASVLVSDPTQANVPSLSPGPAASMVYGRAFDVSSNGRVMYEGGHNHGGTGAANIAAQRAFLNFWLLALIDRSPDVAISSGSITAVNEGGTITLSSNITHQFPITSYQWTSSAGGTFSAPNSATTQFIPPEVSADTQIVIRLSVSDGCNRTAFDAYPLLVRNVPKADLAITKTDSKDPVGVLEAFSYSLAVSNLGTDAADTVVVRDVLPAGLTFVSATGSGWSCTFNSGTREVSCTRSTLAITGSTPSVITISVLAPAATGVLTNTATVSATTPDFVPGNNSSSQTTQVLSGIDVSIAKTAPGGSFYPGAAFTYTLNVQNQSALAATSITVDDVLAAALTYVSATGTGWDCVYNNTDRRVTCFRASLVAGASAPISLTVVPSGAAGSVIANTATVSSPAFNDAVPSNNSSSVNVTLSAPADLRLTKTASVSGSGGSAVSTYIVTLANLGPGTASNVVVTDVMSGSSLGAFGAGCSVTPSSGTISPSPSPWSLATITAGGTWTVATLANGASATLTLACTGDNKDGVLNRATITSTGTYDPVTSNNSASAFISTDTIENTDLQLVKTASANPVLVGDPFSYRITVNNLGIKKANNTITVTDVLPAGVTYVSSSNITGGGAWNCINSAGTVTCTTGTDLEVSPTIPNSLFFNLNVTAPNTGGSITNSATVRYTWGNDQYDPPDNNTGSVQTTVNFKSTDIAVTKTVNTSTPPLGSNVIFTVTARNAGSNAASNLRVQDVLPAGLSLVSAVASQGSYDPATGLWYVGNLAASVSVTLTVTATATQGGTITNTACFYAMDQTDTVGTNNCASAVVSPQVADLSLTKTVDNTTPAQNSNVTFTVTLTNLGASAASAISVQDSLPTGLTYVSHAAALGTYNPASGIWQIPGPLANSGVATLTLVATITVAESPMVNTAVITSASVPDPVSTNNSASATVTGKASDIEVTKTVDTGIPTALGTPLTFTITAKNNGPSDAASVTVVDSLPTGLTYQSHGTSQGTYVPGSGAWTIGPLATGATATLALVATNTQFGLLTNTATRTTSSPIDLGPTNDTASAQVLSGGSADLALTKTVDRPFAVQGDTVTFTLQLDNYGPNPASGVVVMDLLPAGMTYSAHAVSQGTYNPVTGVWTVGALAVSQRVTLTISAAITGSGNLINTANVTALNQADADLTNNSSSAAVNVSPAADLAVTKTGPGNASVGAPVTYTLIARNNGPAPVVGASLVDTVPSQITVSGWACVASGSADCDLIAAGTGASGSTNAITLPNISILAGAGNFLTITVNGVATSAGTITNTAVFSPPNNLSVLDTNILNNSASVVTVISNSNLTGRVFSDTGSGGGIANDGVLNGTEVGIPGVPVRLTDCGSTTYATTTTDASGAYTLGIPVSLSAGATLCVVQSNLSGYLSTGGQVGSTGGTYTRTSDTTQFTLVANGTYTGINFGDVPANRFLNDGARTVLPGTTVTYPHVYIAATAGQVTFSSLSVSSPAGLPWSQVLYRDVGCDGAVNSPTDTSVSGAISVVEGDRVCVVLQQFVPANAPLGSSNVVTLQAFFAYSNASPALSATASRQDITTVSDVALQLLKEVRNVTQGGIFGNSNAARPGEVLEYRLTYTNGGVASINNLVINDSTPTYTVFLSAACVTPLPTALTTCAITAPAANAVGALRWQYTGSLVSGVSGVVTYQVRVQ